MSFNLAAVKKFKLLEVDEQRMAIPISELEERSLINGYDFFGVLKNKKRTNIIAEVKKASPSKGIIREDFDHVAIAKSYEQAGAAAISVLTDKKYFMGDLDYLANIRSAVKLPILRKDFIVSEYQILESLVFGASAILLIVGMLDDHEIKDFKTFAESYNLSCLVEVHNEKEMERAIKLESKIIGINNRDLNSPDLKTDLTITETLSKMIPKDVLLVSESGIHSKDDITRLKSFGANAFLIGESLMRSDNIEEKLGEFL